MNKKDKRKVESNIKLDVKIKAEQTFEHFKEFTDGVRVLFLIHRNKEGGETNNTKTMKVVTTNPEDFLYELTKLIDYKERNSDIPYRIYSSVNSRDIGKAIRQLKYEQLDADYYGENDRDAFYLDIKNRWIGCLMQPKQKETSNFLFDIDDVEGKDLCGETLKALSGCDDCVILKQYKTKNGWHIVTGPFNYTKLYFPERNFMGSLPDGVEIKTDALLLLAY